MDNHKDDEFLVIHGINLNGRTIQTHDRSGWVVGNEFAFVLTMFMTVLAGALTVLGSWIFIWLLAVMVLLDLLIIYPYYLTLYKVPDLWK